MTSSRDDSRGFTVLDGVALLLGSAVGSIHLRGPAVAGLMRDGQVLFWLTFAGVTLTAAGPFLFLARRFGRRPPDYPQLGDRLWAILGLPWLATAPLRASARRVPSGPHLYTFGLVLAIGVASLATLAIIWTRWVGRPPTPTDDEPRPWTSRVGLIVSVAWPLQCGFGLVIISS